ncbi:MAG TPA: phosphoribosyltransferase [Oxalicibacterium sp.]|nr:phosphoribosyltransferase [Oxalicibacterium sp.]
MPVPESDDQHLWVSWDAYHRAVESLALQVHASGWKFDHVLCLSRGGLRPGDVFSRIFDVPLAVLSVSSYREGGGTTQGQLNIADHITTTGGKLAGKVLLIDDLVDSGITLQQVQRHLAEQFSLVNEVRTAVIWYKACSVLKPDFYVEYLPGNPWIHQPFEQYDSLRPHQLEAWMKKGEQ